MNISTLLHRNQATLKLMFIAMLSLAMLIPMMMVRSIISERQNMQLAARQTIADRWGGTQHIGGLVALTQAQTRKSGTRGMEMQTRWRASVLSELSMEADMTTEWRNLGIYDLPVYTARITVRGRVDWAEIDTSQTSGDLLFWLPLSDVRGVREVSLLKLDNLELSAEPLGMEAIAAHGLQFTVPERERERLRMMKQTGYQVELVLAGSNALLFLPLADTTRINLRADWLDPEFVGQFLPFERNIEQHTTASWKLLGLNRPFGNEWMVGDLSMQQIQASGFGMRLETPVDIYQRSERAVKYGFLFISLTFFTLFLFEVTTARPLHPVPYVLTGAALAVFYLVLLALSEYLSFSTAFATAAGLLVLIVTPYTTAVLGCRLHGLLVGVMLGVTYGLLYVLVSAQHAALLLGSLSLLTAIASLMYLTRKIDWYAYSSEKQ